MIASSLLNAAYWLPIVYLAYFKAPPGARLRIEEAEPALLWPTLICAAYVIMLGLTTQVPGLPFSLAQAAVRFVFGM
jgi:multicomponent Na+:H+ antiporter subunit D